MVFVKFKRCQSKVLLVLSIDLTWVYCFVAGFPNYDYSGDDYNYPDDNEPIANEEEEVEIEYDINFLNVGRAQIVDKGTTIKLPCNVDKYPGMLQFSSVQCTTVFRGSVRNFLNLNTIRVTDFDMGKK